MKAGDFDDAEEIGREVGEVHVRCDSASTFGVCVVACGDTEQEALAVECALVPTGNLQLG